LISLAMMSTPFSSPFKPPLAALNHPIISTPIAMPLILTPMTPARTMTTPSTMSQAVGSGPGAVN